MKLFGEIDFNSKGELKNEFPSWYMRSQIEELERSIEQKEIQLEQGTVPQSEIGLMRERLKNERDKLDRIHGSKPAMSSGDKDLLAKAVKCLEKEIRESMFSLDDMKRGIADAHEEARRMTEPIIKVYSDAKILVEACKVRVSDGAITRNEAVRCWKIGRRYLGENSNVESIRRA